MFDLTEELKKLPDKPGVYLMHSKSDEIIYVGKAINLKNRVRQYFQTSRTRSPKIEKMVSRIAWFEYIITDSELEALVLENNLIKEHRPRYNTMLKDDKSYPFIRVTVEEEFPRILFARQMKRDKSRYFGPFTSSAAVKDTIDLLKKLYHVRSCNRSLPRDIGKERPCLYYQIHQCPAPCQGYISEEAYREHVDRALSFLDGDFKPVVRDLEQKMQQAAESLDFEQAAEYRDLLDSVRHVTGKQRITNADAEDRDIIAIAMDDREAVVAAFFVRQGKILGREHFHMTGSEGESASDILNAFIKQYYAGTPFLPRQILIEEDISERQVVEDWLTKRQGHKVNVLVPKRGEKHKLMALAKENAELVLRQDLEKIKRQEARTIGAVREMEGLLGLSGLSRMEAFDISNISGVLSVASMVVFENGKAKKNDYRKFRLRTVTGPDDYKSMEEVLTRRFTDERFDILPDLLLMDGGKGQVNVALNVLEQLNICVPVVGMVKDDNHRTRGLYYNNTEICFPAGSEAFALITRIQDEAHRFAITYHKQLRGKEQVHSILDDIKGIGPVRRKQLMMHFKDIAAIREADYDALLASPGMTAQAAKSVYIFFHPDADTEA
ncbi:MAG: excinuclease ABC subunit UvrC [Lachnospiraceae bacterium]|nr:excinuclease ABC subunit UvrC [Lachnospiraceae bacterium]